MDLPSAKVAPPPHAFETAPAGAEPSASTSSQITPATAALPAQQTDQPNRQAEARQRTDALLRDLWQRKLPTVRDQIRTLERVLEALDVSTLTPPLRSDAAMAAHKLAGSLGMFGFHDGTHFARQLESLLDSEQPLSRTLLAGPLQQLIASLNL